MDMATEISSFIFLNNPDAFFHPGLLDAGFYVGLYLKDSSTGGLDVLIATAGTHVINSAVNVAAIGNVVVSSTYRNTGYGTIATAVVCNALVSKGYRTIGLNVMESNIGAVKCYQKLGFSISCTFYETEMQKKSL
jgi:ribosomal protein S18 acetylase RimI-like enzyme